MAGETTGNQEAFELIEANPPGIVILSQSDVKSDCAEITRRIKAHFPAVSVVLITGKNEGEQLFPAIVSGASATFTPDIDPELMLAVIRDVAQGRLPIIEALATPPLAARALADFKDLATLNERLGIYMAPLTKKEAEILSAIASGGGIEQAAAKLTLSEDVVRNHLRAVLLKLVANDRIRAIVEKTQVTLPSLMSGLLKGSGASPEYLTRAEFNGFKDSLLARFKTLVGEKP